MMHRSDCHDRLKAVEDAQPFSVNEAARHLNTYLARLPLQW
jgi:hypothetical protein